MTVTLELPDDVAERFFALPEETRNRFAVAALRDQLEELEEEVEDTPRRLRELVPVDWNKLSPAEKASIEAGYADLDAGRFVDGETFFRHLRQGREERRRRNKP